AASPRGGPVARRASSHCVGAGFWACDATHRWRAACPCCSGPWPAAPPAPARAPAARRSARAVGHSRLRVRRSGLLVSYPYATLALQVCLTYHIRRSKEREHLLVERLQTEYQAAAGPGPW